MYGAGRKLSKSKINLRDEISTGSEQPPSIIPKLADEIFIWLSLTICTAS